MKKIILFFSLLLVLLPLKVLGAENDSYIDWELDRSIFVHQIRNGEDHVTNLAIIKANNVIAYCIEPGVLADKDSYYNSTYNIADTPLGNMDTKYMSLVGYFGYGYGNHLTKEYYMAAQELIWESMGVEEVWFSDNKFGGNIYDINKEKQEILDLVRGYETIPKFNIKKEYMIGDEIALKDENNVLDKYELVNNNNVSLSNGALKVRIASENISFELKKGTVGKGIKFYYKSGYQTIGSFETGYEFSKKYNINGKYGKIIVDKLDSETKSKKTFSPYASLKGAVYALYDSEEKEIARKTTDDNGMIVFDKLLKGNYSIKEISPSVGYNVSKTIIRTYLSSSRFEAILKTYEDIIKNKLYIIKVLDNKNGDLVPENGIEFMVLNDRREEVLRLFTNEKGILEFELPYGNYILRQLSSPEGISKVDDLKIKVTEDGLKQEFTLINEKLEKPPVVEELPNTGKRGYIILILLSIFSSLGLLYYEKNSF